MDKNGRMTDAETLQMWMHGVREQKDIDYRIWYIKHVVAVSFEKRVEALAKLEGLI